MEPKYTISIFVNNQPGVLMRLTQTFARRGYNIDSLVVSAAHDPEFSRITVVAQGSPEVLDQIIRQLNKLVDVVHASHHQSGDSVARELGLYKVRADKAQRVEVFQIADVFRAKTLDITDESLIVEVTGDSGKLDAMEKILAGFGIIEMVRSGKLLMARGLNPT